MAKGGFPISLESSTAVYGGGGDDDLVVVSKGTVVAGYFDTQSSRKCFHETVLFCRYSEKGTSRMPSMVVSITILQSDMA